MDRCCVAGQFAGVGVTGEADCFRVHRQRDRHRGRGQLPRTGLMGPEYFTSTGWALPVNLQFHVSRLARGGQNQQNLLGKFARTSALDPWTHVVKPNKIDTLAFTVLRNLQQIDDTQETRLARQLWSDIRKTNRLDGIHLDLTFFHTVSPTDFDVGTRPYSDTTSDFSATNALAKSLAEDHESSLHPTEHGGAASLLRFRRIVGNGLSCRSAPRRTQQGETGVIGPFGSA